MHHNRLVPVMHGTLPASRRVHASVAPGAGGQITQIDGLRGIAVLAVVIYHFMPASLSGGFIGVDVFFVISGFLIGGILWRELTARGTISLGAFFMRRIRRLAPAYFVMAAVTAAVAYLVLLPFEFREFGKSLIASVAYLSNVHFFREAGYFDTASENKVLLHTWSLSVEEQFYLAIPLLILVLRRRPRLLIGALVAIAAASLAACVLLTPRTPTATFYLFPFRAWELLAGVLLAIAVAERNLSSSYGAWASWFGIGFIAASIVLIRPGHGFPGYQVILPIIGTTMLIANIRDRNPVNAALAWPPLVFVGLISYSLYLWHWPVLTLSSYFRDGYASSGEMLGWLAVAFGAATLSWRFVEKPVREARGLPALALIGASATASAVLLLAGGLAYVRDGMPGRFGPEVRMHIEASADFLQDWSRCNVPANGPFAGIEVCPVGADGSPTFLVWGDSHVRAFKEGIDLAARENDASGLVVWRAGCPPLFDISKRESATTPLQDEACMDANARMRKALPQLKEAGIEKILLIGRWTYYAHGGGVGSDAMNTIELNATANASPHDQSELFTDAVLASVEEIAGHVPAVYVLEQVPEVPFYDSREVARRLAHGADQHEEQKRFVVSRRDVEERSAAAEAGFLKLAKRDDRIHWLPTRDRLCEDGSCSSVHDAHSYYFDNNHITNTAAMALRDLFVPVLGSDRSVATTDATDER